MRLTVDTTAANEIIQQIKKIDKRNEIDMEFNPENCSITIHLAKTLKLKLVDDEENVTDFDDETVTKEPKPPKAKKSNNDTSKFSRLDISEFRNAIDSLGGEGTQRNIEIASKITEISKASLYKWYGCEELTYSIYPATFEKLKKLFNYKKTKPKLSNDEIMIARVMRAKNTTDPAVIAKTISSSKEMLKQTTFKSYDDVIRYIENRQSANKS